MANNPEAIPLHGDPLQHILRFLDQRSLCAVCQVLMMLSGVVLQLRSGLRRLCAYTLLTPPISLYFDARGDLDSRRPNASFAAVVVDRPSHNYHVAGRMQPNMSDLIQTSKVKHCSLWDSTPRHSRGCLIWHEQELFESSHPKVGSPYELRDTSNGQHPKLKDNKALSFCFANAVVSDYQHPDADCTCAELLKIPAHTHYKDAFMTQCTSFELPSAQAEIFKSYVEDESRSPDIMAVFARCRS